MKAGYSKTVDGWGGEINHSTEKKKLVRIPSVPTGGYL